MLGKLGCSGQGLYFEAIPPVRSIGEAYIVNLDSGGTEVNRYPRLLTACVWYMSSMSSVCAMCVLCVSCMCPVCVLCVSCVFCVCLVCPGMSKKNQVSPRLTSQAPLKCPSQIPWLLSNAPLKYTWEGVLLKGIQSNPNDPVCPLLAPVLELLP